jgi:hypothetical protein
MSFSASAWARTVSFGSPIRKAIAYTLADHRNHESGRCDPSVPTIAREADAGIRAVEINLRWMERAGAISILRRPGRCNSYILNFAWGTATSPIRGASRKQRPPAPDAGVSAPTPAFDGVEAAPTPAPDAPEPERKKENQKEEEDARERARPAPLSDEFSETRQEGSRIEGVPPRPPEPPSDRVTFPDEVLVLTPEIVAEIREAGHDPAELTDEVREWAIGEGATSNNWPRVVVHWGRRNPPKRRRRIAASPAGQPAKPDRFSRTVAAFAAVAAARQQQEARP